MSIQFNITNIWKHIKSGKNPPKHPDIDAHVSFREMNRFHSDMNFRQYYKTEVPERYELLNDITRIKSGMIINNHFRPMK